MSRLACAAGFWLTLAAAASPAPASDDAAKDQRQLFYDAVAKQQAHEFEGAVALYRRYLAIDPQSGVALNNLARALEALGRYPEAATEYEKAIALGDARRLFYTENYANSLAKAGNWKAAERVYRSLAKEQPLASATHAALIEYYLSKDPGGLLAYLWELAAEGQAERACLGALDALAKPVFDHQRKLELLAVVASALSRMTYEPARLGDTEAGRRLRQLTLERDDRGRCVSEILKLHERAGTRDDYGCWNFAEPRLPERPSHTEAFQALIRALGRRYRAQGDGAQAAQAATAYDNAAAYFRLSVELNRDVDVDPRAFDELVRLEVARNNVKGVATLAEQYERLMFDAKGMAIAQKKDERIFEFHRALGEMYAVLGVWGSSNDARSATFQLEHARAASTRLDRAFNADLTDLLARCYRATGRETDAWALRLDQAEKFQKAGDHGSVEEVLAPVREAAPPPQFKHRFDLIMKDRAIEPQAREWLQGGRFDLADRNRNRGDALHVHRTKDLEIVFVPEALKADVHLTAAQQEQIFASLETFFERASRPHAGKVTWDAPSNVKSVDVDEKGQGFLTVDIDGKPVKLRFEVKSDRKWSAPISWRER